MSTAEIIGIALSAFFVGLVLGDVFAGLRERRNRRIDERSRRRDAFVRWLGARNTLSRTSTSFVAAFRVLRKEPSDSAYHSLRMESAHHARIQWCDAMRELESAEAAMITWCPRFSLDEMLAKLKPPGSASLRGAIHADPAELEAFLREWNPPEKNQVAFIRSAFDFDDSHDGSLILRFLRRFAQLAKSIVDAWG